MEIFSWIIMSIILTWWMQTGQINDWCNIWNYQTYTWINVQSWSKQKQSLVNYGWKISWNDMDFLTTIEQESKWNPKAIGDKWRAFWLCQWRIEWHKWTIKNKRFNDPYWQVEQCWKYYKAKKNNWTIWKQLYWWNVRKQHEKLFKKVSKTINQTNSCKKSYDVNDEIEKFLLNKKIKYKLWWIWPEYFDCGWIVTFALQKVKWYTWSKISSFTDDWTVNFKNAKRGDILISTIDGERHVAWIAKWYDWKYVTVLDYVDNWTTASFRQYTFKKWIMIIKI